MTIYVLKGFNSYDTAKKSAEDNGCYDSVIFSYYPVNDRSELKFMWCRPLYYPYKTE